MTDERMGPFMDAAAELRADLARLNEQVLLLALAVVGLGVVLTFMAWHER